ncbi:hypothetical protein E2C01_095193 [Portunus trituberculatus]|uniref:Uncharacterized protein n=1 Tax=Portunus trituberculatus TaxID=210409 RepID=A0A5B7K3K0_PORTR|nr:hypothetical protein [Portunus trituberculatus]
MQPRWSMYVLGCVTSPPRTQNTHPRIEVVKYQPYCQCCFSGPDSAGGGGARRHLGSRGGSPGLIRNSLACPLPHGPTASPSVHCYFCQVRTSFSLVLCIIPLI